MSIHHVLIHTGNKLDARLCTLFHYGFFGGACIFFANLYYVTCWSAEVAELADALGSGPSPVHTGWRFKSSLRQFRVVRLVSSLVQFSHKEP